MTVQQIFMKMVSLQCLIKTMSRSKKFDTSEDTLRPSKDQQSNMKKINNMLKVNKQQKRTQRKLQNNKYSRRYKTLKNKQRRLKNKRLFPQQNKLILVQWKKVPKEILPKLQVTMKTNNQSRKSLILPHQITLVMLLLKKMKFLLMRLLLSRCCLRKILSSTPKEKEFKVTISTYFWTKQEKYIDLFSSTTTNTKNNSRDICWLWRLQLRLPESVTTTLFRKS